MRHQELMFWTTRPRYWTICLPYFYFGDDPSIKNRNTSGTVKQLAPKCKQTTRPSFVCNPSNNNRGQIWRNSAYHGWSQWIDIGPGIADYFWSCRITTVGIILRLRSTWQETRANTHTHSGRGLHPKQAIYTPFVCPLHTSESYLNISQHQQCTKSTQDLPAQK